MEQVPVYTRTTFLAAPRCNAQGELSVASIASDIIDVATEHANSLGIGYAELIPEGIAWVLSRLNIRMLRYPRMHETYCVRTWVESFTRSFSNRNFHIYIPGSGETLGYVRSVWTAIDINERKLADLSGFTERVPLCAGEECLAEIPSRIPLAEGAGAVSSDYKFRVTDIDFNRHVNTVRYVDMIINTHPLEVYDRCYVAGLELSFRHEAVYGQTGRITVAPGGLCTISDAAEPHTPFVVSRIRLQRR